MPMIVSICQHFGEQQFRNTVMCSSAPYTIFSIAKLDLSCYVASYDVHFVCCFFLRGAEETVRIHNPVLNIQK